MAARTRSATSTVFDPAILRTSIETAGVSS